MTDMLRKICCDYGTWLRSRIAFYCSWPGLFEKWPGIFNFDPVHSYNEIIIIANAITLNKKNIKCMSFVLLLYDRRANNQIPLEKKKKTCPRINEGFFSGFR